MFRAAIRSLLAHKLRLLLTVLTIVLGIAFVSGTYIFTDSLQRSFNALFDQRAPDVTVTPFAEFAAGGNEGGEVLALPGDLVATFEGVPGVAAAYGAVRADAAIVLGPDGVPLGSRGAPTRAQSWVPDPSISALTLTSGAAPVGPSQVALLEATATLANVGIGDKVTIDTPANGASEYTVSGLASRGVGGSLGGTLVLFDLPTAQANMLGSDQLTEIDVKATAGQDPIALAAALTKAAGATKVSTQTATEARAALADRLSQTFTFVDTFLLVFGLIALFVAGFLIFNTFSMLVAQRTRELALLRAVGATRRQVQWSVVLEALMLGLVASTLGLLAGFAVSQGLRALFSVFGAALPAGPLVLEPRTVIFAYSAGMIVTVVSAFIPARRASVIPPVAAMRDEIALPKSSLRLRLIVGLVLLGIAIPAALIGLSSTDDGQRASTWIGISALTALVGAIALAPNVSRPVLGFLGLPFSRTSMGKLGTENGRRNPRRTASTSTALAIGLALMTGIGVIASSAQASVEDVIDSTIGADFIIFGQNFQPFTHDVYEAVRDTPGASTVAYVRQTPVRVNGDQNLLSAVDTGTFTEIVNLEFTQGSLEGLTLGTVAADTKTVADAGFTVGQKIPFTLRTGAAELTLAGVYKASGPFTGFVSSLDTLASVAKIDRDSGIYIRLAKDADVNAVRSELDKRLEAFPSVKLQDQADLKKEIVNSFNQVFGFIYALLALAVIVAFLGIVNTLSLSVFERTREIGLLRAVGATRAQIRRMVLVESVLIAVFGALTGVVIGLIYGSLLQRVLAPQGISILSIPTGQVLLFLVLGAVGGLLAALWPAWRASRLDVLKAIATS